MIQFNLLPDVKLEYIRAKRLKTLLTSISIIVGAASFMVAVVLFFAVAIVQKDSIKDLNKDIEEAAKQVKETPDINRILTVQNQLQSLSTVHSTKPAVTRFFDYISRVTPVGVTLSSTKLDLVGNTLTISGQAPDLLSVNRYVDTLKFTTYTEVIEGEENSDAEGLPAFTQVLLSGFASDKIEATYQLSMAFDPAIFDNQKEIKLVVPNKITTRSQQQLQQKNTDVLFKEDPTQEQEEQ